MDSIRQNWQSARQHAIDVYLKKKQPSVFFKHFTSAVEQLLQDLWRALAMDNQLCLLAIGGLGRMEVYPHSDWDLAIVGESPLSIEQQTKITQWVQFLWDNRIQPAVKSGSLAEICDGVAQDLTADTAFLEARFLCGNADLAKQTLQTLTQQRNTSAFLAGKLTEMHHRHAKQLALPLEPDIKNCTGGLRDLHTMMWLAQAQGLSTRFHDLFRQGILTRAEASRLARCHKNLAQIRIQLHLVTGRDNNHLSFDLQKQIAINLGWGAENRAQEACENLMQKVYRNIKRVMQLNGILLPMLSGRVADGKKGDIIKQINTHFYSVNNQLAVDDLSIFQKDSTRILQLAEILQKNRELEGIDPKTLRAWWAGIQQADFSHAVNRQRFIGFFKHGVGLTSLLRLLNIYGVLERYLPAWGKIVGLLQHDLFHVYPVDDHILTVLGRVRQFALDEYAHEMPFESALMQNFEPKYILYLSALFHDVAKGRMGDHAQLGAQEALSFAREHELPEAEGQLLAWLVQQHLLMSLVAQKQDIDDPAVIDRFVQVVDSQEKLTALYLLTVADIRGTNPKIWNAWKAGLLRKLFQITAHRLLGESQTLESLIHHRKDQAVVFLQQKMGMDQKKIRQLWQALGEAYFVRHDLEEILWQLPLLAQGHERSFVHIEPMEEGQTFAVLVLMPNGERLFTRLCRIFSHHDLDIVMARAFVTDSNHILDSFVVQLAEGFLPDDVVRVQQKLLVELNDFVQNGVFRVQKNRKKSSRRVIHQPLAPRLTLRPDPERLHWYVLEIVANNRSGLLEDITEVFARHGVSLRHAKILSLADRIEDSFLIFHSGLINPLRELEFRSCLLRKLEIH